MIKRFARRAMVLAAACVLASAQGTAMAADAAAADPVVLNPDRPSTYTVQPGDTLWGISAKFLANPWQWPEIWQVNDKVANPHLIYPGDVLRLVWRDGKPVLVSDGAGTIGSGGSVVEELPGGDLKLRPRIREMPLSAAIPAIPLKNIEAFLVDSRVVEPDELKRAPYIVAGPDKRIVMGVGDDVFGRDRQTKWASTYPEYGIYRSGVTYVDPETSLVLGLEARRVGATRLIARDGEIATMRVLDSQEELRIGDKFMYDEQRRVQSVFNPRAAPDGVEGRIIHAFDTIGHVARNDVVVLNRGRVDGVEAGHVFSILQNTGATRDREVGDVVYLPPTRAGLLIVFRTFEKVSYALITKSTRAIAIGDVVRKPRIDVAE